MSNDTKPRITRQNLPQRFLKGRELLMAHFRPILNHFELSDQQWRILRLLDEYLCLEPRDLCNLCQIHSASMVGMLARMEERGLIRRSPIPTDQRRVAVQLAPQGDKLVSEIAPLIDQQYRHLEEALGTDVFKNLSNALEAFIAKQDTPVPRVQLPLHRQ
ncbi:MAG: homoprotocatechuate degradation operon regulator HpaR [Burkholderiales bacterium]|nr:homoprotocatechuate degradation operon regulator HpaR [Burkholderiales bacterium]